MPINNFIAILGLIIDINGAWYLSKGLMLKTREQIIKETGFSYSNNDDYTISGIYSKIECSIGFIFLFLGFIFQASTYIIPSNVLIVKNVI